MPRGKRATSDLDTEAKRAKLPARHDPYWEPVQGHVGVALGLYKPGDWRAGAACTWRLRVRLSGRYAWEVLAIVADGQRLAGGKEGPLDILDYHQALERAKERAKATRAAARLPAGVQVVEGEEPFLCDSKPVDLYTVADALTDYRRRLIDEGKPSGRAVDYDAPSILPTLGTVPVATLTLTALEGWRDRLVMAAPLRRLRPGVERPKKRKALAKVMAAEDLPEAQRKRRVRVNRIIGALKAALNRAEPSLLNRGMSGAGAWRKLKKFSARGAGGSAVEKGRIRALTVEEQQNLIDHCEPPEFRDLVLGALATGGRYGELTRLVVGNLAEVEGAGYWRVTFPAAITKSGKERTVALSDDGAAVFLRCCKGKAKGARIFLRPGGEPWKKNEQTRPFRRAVEAAGIDPYPFLPTFHQLRDTYVKRLAVAGVPISTVSKIIGHSSVTTTEQHYHALFPAELDEAARKLPALIRPPAAASEQQS